MDNSQRARHQAAVQGQIPALRSSWDLTGCHLHIIRACLHFALLLYLGLGKPVCTTHQRHFKLSLRPSSLCLLVQLAVLTTVMTHPKFLMLLFSTKKWHSYGNVTLTLAHLTIANIPGVADYKLKQDTDSVCLEFYYIP